ncbi:MAG: hypothetical protein LAP21_16165 [Acidobacteriia bacterium]|nr:hypothetical protein [Terriglobia bacterium]
MLNARSFTQVLCLVLASVVLLSASTTASSEFTGAYVLGAPTAAGNEIQLSISFNVANNTSSGISNATLAVHDPRAARVTYGEITGISIAAGDSVRATGFFKVPKSLHDSWQRGNTPAVSVTYNDADGNAVKAFIQFQ